MLRLRLVDNVQPAFSADDLIVWADFFNAGTHFHADHLLSRVTHCFYLVINVLFTKWMQLEMKSEDRKLDVFDILRVRTGAFRSRCAIL